MIGCARTTATVVRTLTLRPEITRTAHSLKSTSANVGATTMSKLCADLQAAGKIADLGAARTLLARADAEYDRVQTALTAELALLADL